MILLRLGVAALLLQCPSDVGAFIGMMLIISTLPEAIDTLLGHVYGALRPAYRRKMETWYVPKEVREMGK